MNKATRVGMLAGLIGMVLGLAFVCADIALGVIFFPIGPEGLTPRDALVQRVSQVLLAWGATIFCAGLAILLVMFILRRMLHRST